MFVKHQAASSNCSKGIEAKTSKQKNKYLNCPYKFNSHQISNHVPESHQATISTYKLQEEKSHLFHFPFNSAWLAIALWEKCTLHLCNAVGPIMHITQINQSAFSGKLFFTCSSGEPNERHCTNKDTAPALRAVSTGGNSDRDNKRLSSRRAWILFCIAPFPLQ